MCYKNRDIYDLDAGSANCNFNIPSNVSDKNEKTNWISKVLLFTIYYWSIGISVLNWLGGPTLNHDINCTISFHNLQNINVKWITEFSVTIKMLWLEIDMKRPKACLPDLYWGSLRKNIFLICLRNWIKKPRNISSNEN